MAKKNYVVIRSGTYGVRGAIVELDLGKDGLSDRQKVMLKDYAKPVAKADSKEVDKLKSDLAAAKGELSGVKDELEGVKSLLESVSAELVEAKALIPAADSKTK